MHIYCSGIGGIGLSAYAALQKHAGHQVAGSDRTESALLEDLRSQGIDVFLEQDGSHVTADLDLFVYSEAIPESAPERQKAAEYGIKQLSYFQALGELSKEYRVIAVCGTHGKSSTTAMAAKVLADAHLDPSVVVGTKVPDLNGRNWRSGQSNLFLLEACEYRRSFHFLQPDIVLMLNADGDHYDAFADVAEYQQAFLEFLQLLPEDGVVITRLRDPDCQSLAEQSGRRIIGCDDQPLADLQTPGKHMQENAQFVFALADELGVDQAAVHSALSSYKGCWRRLELKGEYRISNLESRIPVFDDYGHHPIEVNATIQALKEKYPDNRLVCVFQPHMHDRTLKLYDEFLAVLKDIDVLIIPNVYDARHDVEKELVDVEKLVGDIAALSSGEVINGQSLAEAERLLKEEILREGDVLLCMGAGDITDLAERMVN